MTHLFKTIWRIVVVCAPCGIVMLALGLPTMNSPKYFPGQVGARDMVEQAIKKLWSADDTIRRRGREEVLQIGPAAVGALRDLLKDLIRDRRPRFATETEEEGRRALEAYLALPEEEGRKALEAYVALLRSNEQPFDDNEDFRNEDYRTVSRLAINSRLTNDAISLLGELRAAEGVPILIHIMERHETGGSEPVGIELDALTRIGSAAVPYLIKAIQDADITARTVIFEWPLLLGSISISTDPDPYSEGDDEEEPEPEGSDQLDPEEKWEMERKAFIIREKALRVLEEIGDETALPFLESLLKTEENRKAEGNRNWNIVHSVQAAIAKIKGETRGGSFPARSKIPWEER